MRTYNMWLGGQIMTFNYILQSDGRTSTSNRLPSLQQFLDVCPQHLLDAARSHVGKDGRILLQRSLPGLRLLLIERAAEVGLKGCALGLVAGGRGHVHEILVGQSRCAPFGQLDPVDGHCLEMKECIQYCILSCVQCCIQCCIQYYTLQYGTQ